MSKLSRREAVAALFAGATFTRIPAAELKPTDMIVISFPGRVTSEMAERIKAMAREKLWPNHKVLVLEQGATVQVVAGK